MTEMPVKEPLPGPHTPEAVEEAAAGRGNPSRLCARGEAAAKCVASCTYDECHSAIRLPTPHPDGNAIHLQRAPAAFIDAPIPRAVSAYPARIATNSIRRLADGTVPACDFSRVASTVISPRREATLHGAPRIADDACHDNPSTSITIHTTPADVLVSAPANTRSTRPVSTMQ